MKSVCFWFGICLWVEGASITPVLHWSTAETSSLISFTLISARAELFELIVVQRESSEPRLGVTKGRLEISWKIRLKLKSISTRSRRSVYFICLFTLELAFANSHVLRFVDSGLIIGITSNRVCLILSDSFPTPFASVGNFNKFIALSNLVLEFSDFFPLRNLF